MTELILRGRDSAVFITHACRYARPPVAVSCRGDHLLLQGMSCRDIAAALACAVFPRRERQRLRALARRLYRCRDAAAQEELAAVAQALAEEDIPGCPLYCGAHRGEALTAALEPLVAAGPLDFAGFCRFRLPGYEAYLRQLAERAAQELLAQEDEEEYYRQLRLILGRGQGSVTLFFYPGDICQIWQRDSGGIRQLEGGHIRGVEWLVLANLICLAPAELRLRHSTLAPPALLSPLEKVFGDRLVLDDSAQNFSAPSLDNQPEQC